MQNPWPHELPSSRSYILEIDRENINRYNASVHNEEKKVVVESVPEPFIGNPQSATVVLLNLNPGHSEGDIKAHNDAEFRNAMVCNLRHKLQKYPFYPLNPKFERTPCGIWWLAHIRNLLEVGLDRAKIAEKLLVIEWFPYHSKRSALREKPVCESQKYSFQLAKEMLENNLVVVGMRSKKHWAGVDPRFSNVPFLRSPLNPVLSPRNAGEETFDRIKKALQ